MTGSGESKEVDEAIQSALASYLKDYGLLRYLSAPWLQNGLIKNEPYQPGDVVFHASSHTLQGCWYVSPRIMRLLGY